MRLIAVFIVLLSPLTVSTVAADSLRGDPEAIVLAEKMIERLGGAEIWSQTRALYLEYDGWRADTSQAVEERAWRDLQEPRQRVIFEGRRSDVIFSLTPETSWLEISDREPRLFNKDEHESNLSFWNFDFYTIIHNLARGDQRIRLEFEAPQIVRIKGPNGADWGWFQIDDPGQPVRWGAKFGDDVLEYIYGPVKAFGNVNFPAWGTAANGFWRFDYNKVDVSRSPIPIAITPPEKG